MDNNDDRERITDNTEEQRRNEQLHEREQMARALPCDSYATIYATHTYIRTVLPCESYAPSPLYDYTGVHTNVIIRVITIILWQTEKPQLVVIEEMHIYPPAAKKMVALDKFPPDHTWC